MAADGATVGWSDVWAAMDASAHCSVWCVSESSVAEVYGCHVFESVFVYECWNECARVDRVDTRVCARSMPNDGDVVHPNQVEENEIKNRKHVNINTKQKPTGIWVYPTFKHTYYMYRPGTDDTFGKINHTVTMRVVHTGKKFCAIPGPPGMPSFGGIWPSGLGAGPAFCVKEK